MFTCALINETFVVSAKLTLRVFIIIITPKLKLNLFKFDWIVLYHLLCID